MNTRAPTLLQKGEGCGSWALLTIYLPSSSAGVLAMARRKGVPGNVGDPLGSGVAASTALSLGAGNQRESDRIIVPVRSVNADGGKGPDFWWPQRSRRGGD